MDGGVIFLKQAFNKRPGQVNVVSLYANIFLRLYFSVNVCAHNECIRGQVLNPLELELEMLGCELPCECGELNPGPLEIQCFND
jgi:hypothetical protein